MPGDRSGQKVHEMSHKSLQNQRAVITGASSGIGEAIAYGFAQAGAAVLINYLSDRDEAERVAQQIIKNGGQAFAVHADVSKPDDCKHLFDIAEHEFAGVDIFVANAGIQRDAAFTDLSLDDWRRV